MKFGLHCTATSGILDSREALFGKWKMLRVGRAANGWFPAPSGQLGPVQIGDRVRWWAAGPQRGGLSVMLENSQDSWSFLGWEEKRIRSSFCSTFSVELPLLSQAHLSLWGTVFSQVIIGSAQGRAGRAGIITQLRTKPPRFRVILNLAQVYLVGQQRCFVDGEEYAPQCLSPWPPWIYDYVHACLFTAKL